MPIKIKRTGTLDIDANSLRLGTFFFKFQLVGILIMVVFLSASLLGLFGNGILSETQVSTPSLSIEYNRYARHQAVNVIHIDVMPDKRHASDDIKIAISQSYFRKISLKSVTPTPSSETIETDRIIYTFPSNHNEAVAHITLTVEPEEFGLIHGNLELIGKQEGKINIKQIIYP